MPIQKNVMMSPLEPPVVWLFKSSCKKRLVIKWGVGRKPRSVQRSTISFKKGHIPIIMTCFWRENSENKWKKL